MMGVRCIRRVLESSPSKGNDRLVLLVLAEHASDDSGQCWPAVETIAVEAAMKVRSVQYAIHALVEAGEIAVELHGAPGTGRRQHRANLYRLGLVVQAAAPLNGTSGAKPCTSPGQVVVQDNAPLNGSSGARNRAGVVQGRAPKPLKNLNPVAKATDNPLTKRAHELAKFAFEQPLKPVSTFPAVLKRIRAALEGGRSDDEVRAAILSGDVVWTSEGLHYAIIRATRPNGNGAVSYEVPEPVYR